MNVLLREIKNDDAKEMAALSEQLGYIITVTNINKNIFMLRSQTDNKVFVAEHNNKAVGWIGVAYVITIQSLPFCEIRGLVVDEKLRGNNIGKLLIEKATAWCKEKKCNILRVRCNVKREQIHAFYSHLGFTEKKEQKIFELNI